MYKSYIFSDFYHFFVIEFSTLMRNISVVLHDFLPTIKALLFCLLLIAFSLTSCGNKPNLPPTPVSLEVITLGPGDVLEIKFYYSPQLNEMVTVLPDGTISLQLAGIIQVQGKSQKLLQQHLAELYAEHLKYPEVTVIVRSLYSRRVYVGGEVNNPGFIVIPGRMSAMEALFRAGGHKRPTAKLENVVVIRHKKGKRLDYKLNLKKALDGDEENIFMLEPFDVVYVPETGITKVNDWVDQYINKVIPNAVWGAIPTVLYYEYYRE